MKTNITIYVASLFLIIAGIVLALGNPSSGRIQLIAGGLTFLGFALNLLSFLKLYQKKIN